MITPFPMSAAYSGDNPQSKRTPNGGARKV